MAQSDEQRIAEFYRNQRLAAEDSDNKSELASIGQKLARGGGAKAAIGKRDLAEAGDARDPSHMIPGATDADIASTALGGVGEGVAGLMRNVMSHPQMAEHVIAEVGPKIAKSIGRLFTGPEDGEEAGGALARTGGRRAQKALSNPQQGARVVGKAKVTDVPKAKLKGNTDTRALPAKSSAKPAPSKPGPIEQAGRAKVKRQNAVIKGAKAAKGTRSDDALPMKGYKPGQKANGDMPKSANAREKMGRAQNKANEAAAGVKTKTQKAAKEGTPRAKGTNPRARMKAGSQGVQKGTNPRAEGKNPRARKKAV